MSLLALKDEVFRESYYKMNDFFSKLFGKSLQTSAFHKHDNPISVQDESDHAKREQLVQMLLHGLLRKHGIPTHLIQLHILVVPGKKHGLGMYVHLITKQWDARLMNHAQAFQNQLLADIKHYEPKCSEWLHGISWQLEMSDSCPYTTLPDKSFWMAPAKPVAATAPVAAVAPKPAAPVATPEPARSRSKSDDHANLERMFSARDQEISKKANRRQQPEFEDTQPLEDEK